LKPFALKLKIAVELDFKKDLVKLEMKLSMVQGQKSFEGP